MHRTAARVKADGRPRQNTSGPRNSGGLAIPHKRHMPNTSERTSGPFTAVCDAFYAEHQRGEAAALVRLRLQRPPLVFMPLHTMQANVSMRRERMNACGNAGGFRQRCAMHQRSNKRGCIAQRSIIALPFNQTDHIQ